MHDHRSLDVGAWAEQWLAWLAGVEKTDPSYIAAEQYIAAQRGLFPAIREVDAKDLGRIMELVCLIGAENPHDRNSTSIVERYECEAWKRLQDDGWLIGRQLVRGTLDDAEAYAAFRIEQERAGTDYMTGAPNRRGLVREMEHKYGITDQPDRHSESGDVLPPLQVAYDYLDANRFRWINRTLGHHIGDAAVVETYWEILDMFRPDDTVYRYGGDEFGVIAAGLTQEEVNAMVERIITWQFEKIRGRAYNDAMDAIEAQLRAVEESGQSLRIGVQQRRITEAQRMQGERPYHTLYINGVAICELRDIVTLAVGAQAGMVSNLDDLEFLRQEGDRAMIGTKRLFDGLLEKMRPIDDGRPSGPPQTSRG